MRGNLIARNSPKVWLVSLERSQRYLKKFVTKYKSPLLVIFGVKNVFETDCTLKTKYDWKNYFGTESNFFPYILNMLGVGVGSFDLVCVI